MNNDVITAINNGDIRKNNKLKIELTNKNKYGMLYYTYNNINVYFHMLMGWTFYTWQENNIVKLYEKQG